MKLPLTWRRALFYAFLPILLVLALIGFPMPLAPPRPAKAGQAQSAPADESSRPHA